MALAIDGICVVISSNTVELRFPGGIAAYEKECPNATYCSDGKICRVAFMVESDARAFAERLTNYGFRSPSNEASEVALVAQRFGLLHPCGWLELDLRTIVAADGRRLGATIAWLRGEDPAKIVAPAGWNPGEMQMMSGADVQNSYEFVEAKERGGGRVETYRHLETGQLIHIGRPATPMAPGVQRRYLDLCNELKTLEERPFAVGREQRAAILERTAQLVKDSGAKEPGPLLLRGIAARFLKQWELAAESFRAVTTLRPDFVDGWLDLTWALAMLGELEEAEACARQAVTLDPRSGPALGNLASVLLQRGNVDEAFTSINRALECDPTDGKNQLILESIRKARFQPAPEARQPWYRRLWDW